jgi:hypothetical protein
MAATAAKCKRGIPNFAVAGLVPATPIRTALRKMHRNRALASRGCRVAWQGLPQAGLFQLGSINSSAEIPSRSCRRRIVAIETPRFRFNISAIVVRVPTIFCVSPRADGAPSYSAAR